MQAKRYFNLIQPIQSCHINFIQNKFIQEFVTLIIAFIFYYYFESVYRIEDNTMVLLGAHTQKGFITCAVRVTWSTYTKGIYNLCST